MIRHLESLETRALFAATVSPVVQTDYDAVTADAAALKSAGTAAYATYRSDAKAIAADVKALGKSKTNAADLAAVNKSVAAAIAADTRDDAKVIATGKSALARAKAAFLADVKSPTAAHLAKLNAALTTLSTALTPLESKLSADVATGDTAMAGALGTLQAANPTDAALSGHVATAETDQSTAAARFGDDVATLNADIDALVAAVTS